jgi:hypothetical protein
MLELLGQAHRKFLIIPNKSQSIFMHGGWQLFSPTLFGEVEGIILKRWVALYAVASMWSRGEREKHTRARSLPQWSGAGRWARAHDVHVNSPPKFGPKPHRSAASFCHLFLL